MLIPATSRGQLPTQRIPSEYLTVFSSPSLKKKKNKTKSREKYPRQVQGSTPDQSGLTSLSGPSPSGIGRCHARMLLPVDMSDAVFPFDEHHLGCLGCIRPGPECHVRTGRQVPSSLKSLWGEEAENQRLLLRFPTITIADSSGRTPHHTTGKKSCV